MLIALEATAACRVHKTGVGRYAIHLMKALAEQNVAGEGGDEYVAYYRMSRRWKKGHEPPEIAGVPNRWYQEPLPLIGRRPEIVHGFEIRVPRWRGVRRVATLHDLFALVSEEFLPAASRRKNERSYQEMADRCHRIIADSESTRRDFLRFFEFPEERVHVVHLGADHGSPPAGGSDLRPLLARQRLERPFLLYVGDITERKNLPRLVRAFGSSRALEDHDLAIVGSLERGTPAFEEALRELPDPERVKILGFVSEEDLWGLYAAAAAFLFPTLYVGFGLPVLEAFSCGTPVLGADVGSVPEIAGGHAVLVDPRDVDALAEGIDRALERTPEELQAAREHAACFTWERCARETRTVYELLAAEGREERENR